MLGHLAASASKIARVILRQELPPKPSARATVMSLSPQKFEMSWMSPWTPTVPVVTWLSVAPVVASPEPAEDSDPVEQAEVSRSAPTAAKTAAARARCCVACACQLSRH